MCRSVAVGDSEEAVAAGEVVEFATGFILTHRHERVAVTGKALECEIGVDVSKEGAHLLIADAPSLHLVAVVVVTAGQSHADRSVRRHRGIDPHAEHIARLTIVFDNRALGAIEVDVAQVQVVAPGVIVAEHVVHVELGHLVDVQDALEQLAQVASHREAGFGLGIQRDSRVKDSDGAQTHLDIFLRNQAELHVKRVVEGGARHVEKMDVAGDSAVWRNDDDGTVGEPLGLLQSLRRLSEKHSAGRNGELKRIPSLVAIPSAVGAVEHSFGAESPVGVMPAALVGLADRIDVERLFVVERPALTDVGDLAANIDEDGWKGMGNRADESVRSAGAGGASRPSGSAPAVGAAHRGARIRAAASDCDEGRGRENQRAHAAEGRAFGEGRQGTRVRAMDPLSRPVALPCGAILPNRLAKAAMTEGLADPDDRASKRLETLYGRWSDGGAGLLISGNVMVDRRYLERPGNVAFDGNGGEEALARMAEAGTRAGNHFWMQINHPGRQCTRMSSNHPVSPSSVKLRGMLGMMAQPRALETSEIRDIIRRFAHVARAAKEAGFTGVQIHAAHGYLASQFLSPHTNRRTDEWGGTLENRARFLLEVYDAVRAAVGGDFPVGAKLNSADFQKGGFSKEESAQVATWLAERGLDLLEISGGTYEQMALLGHVSGERKAESTQRREAYFLEYARDIREAAKDLPLMVTGGFRTPGLMRDVVESGEVDIIGIARPFCVVPDLARAILTGGLDRLPAPEKALRLGPGYLGKASPNRSIRALNGQAEVAWFYQQIIDLSAGQDPDLALGAWPALLRHFGGELARARRRTFKEGVPRLPANTEAQPGA